jgi:hypothetical protein
MRSACLLLAVALGSWSCDLHAQTLESPCHDVSPNGAAKGAAIPLIIWAVVCRQCSAESMLRMTATSALIGLTTDAPDSNRRTLFTGRSSPTLSWRVRF